MVYGKIVQSMRDYSTPEFHMVHGVDTYLDLRAITCCVGVRSDDNRQTSLTPATHI